MSNDTRINIAICTCERERLLGECLRSLDTLELPERVEVSVAVIDNDPAQSARRVVEAYNAQGRFRASYVSEPRRGIPVARNRALDHAMELGADQLVFIDDDEFVAPDWLARLVAFSREKGGEIVVSGDVIPIVPEQVPGPIKGAFTRSDIKTGERMNCCATNNVMIPTRQLRKWGVRFDESRPLAGGTDTIFFVEAVARGAEIYRCAEALVYEHVPLSRANLRWLSKRLYRIGITEAWRRRRKGRHPAAIALSAVRVMLVQGVVSGVAALVRHQDLRIRSWLKVCKAAGVWTGLFGKQVDSYQKIEK